MAPQNITLFEDVDVALRDFEARIREILGNHFLGMYLYGSLALGDFSPRDSDIDFIVLTDAEIAEDLFLALREMHLHFEESDSPWAGKVEAAYIPHSAFRRGSPDHPGTTSARYPQVEKGRALTRDPLEIGWPFQCHILREYGVVIAGPHPRTFIDPVDPHDMRQAMIAIAGGWLEQARHDPGWLSWVRRRDSQAFVVLTLCRFLYMLGSGRIASKPAAARWAQKTLGPSRAALIERSLAGQHDTRETPDKDVDDTIALIQYTVERI